MIKADYRHDSKHFLYSQLFCIFQMEVLDFGEFLALRIFYWLKSINPTNLIPVSKKKFVYVANLLKIANKQISDTGKQNFNWITKIPCAKF